MPEFIFRHLRLVGREHLDLLVAMHGVPQPEARTQLQVAGFEHAFQQQDGAAPAQCPHPLGLVQVQQGEAVGAAHSVVGARYAVAVGIGLDDGPDLGVRGRGAQARQVVAQGFEVDGGQDRAGHEGDFVITYRDITPCRLETAEI
jgi:hypothetical protein